MQCRWRIEIRRGGLVEVYRMAGEWVSNAPLREVRTVDDLGRWMVERGIDPEDLVPA